MSTARGEEFVRRLRAVVDRVIPADRDPGALALGADTYVLAQLQADAKDEAPGIAAGLASLEAEAGKALHELPPEALDKLLAEFETQTWFLSLAELTAEGFYADPANGGNREALSWRMIGYEHRLPEGPNGPMPTGEQPGADGA
jgi:hypothetical protein